MKVLIKILDSLTKTVMGISAIVVFVITFAQVLCRYVLKSPLPWSTDVLRLAFIYLVFWGAAWCVKEKENLCVDVLLTLLPEKTRAAADVMINLVVFVFFLLLIYVGFQFTMTGVTQTTSYLPISMAVYYFSIPSAGVLMAIYMVEILIDQITAFRKEGRKS